MIITDIPLCILLGLHFIVLAEHLIKHGEPRKVNNYNFWTTLLASVIIIYIYYLAGLFKTQN